MSGLSSSSCATSNEQLSNTLPEQGVSDSLLTGVFITISSKLSHLRDSLSRLSIELGAQWNSSLTDATTHFIYQGNRPNDLSKEFKAAKSKGIFIVAPDWLVKVTKPFNQ